MQLPTTNGGLGAPNFRAYYMVSQLQWVAYRLAGRHLWETGLTMEQLSRGELSRLLLVARLPTRDLPLLIQIACRVMRSCVKCLFRHNTN